MEDNKEKVEIVLTSEEKDFYDRLFEKYKDKDRDVSVFELTSRRLQAKTSNLSS